MTSISRVTSRPRQVGTVTFHFVVDLEPEALEQRPLFLVGDVEPQDRAGSLGAETNDGSLGKRVVDVDRAGQLGTGEVDEQAARQDRRGLGKVRVDALLPAVRPLGAEPQPLGGLQHPDRLEVRGLEQHVGRLVGRPRCPDHP